jgi:hypothetical protein
MLDLSLPAADALFGWSNATLILGAALVLGGTVGAIWASKVRDHFADLRISHNEAETATAQANAATANEGAARANEEAAKAKLETETIKARLAWRTLTPDQIQNLKEHLDGQPSSVTLAYTANDPESLFLAIQMSQAFEARGWTIRPQSRSYGSRIIFEISIPGPENSATMRVRSAFSAVGIPYRTAAVPPPDMMFGPTEASEVTVMIGSKPPPF